MTKKVFSKRWIPIAVLVLAAGGAFLAYQRHSAALAGSTETATVRVARGDIEEVVTSQGTLEPRNYVDVGAQVSGQLEKLHVAIGDDVKSGTLIAEIDAKVFESQVAGDEARLKTLQAQKAQGEAEIRQATQKMERNRKLIASKAISQEVYEDSGTALQIAKAQMMSLDAQIEEAQSTLEGNRASLNYTKIYAPMDGTVVALSAKEGETLNANQTTPTIVQIANLDTMTVKARVAEADINKISDGMPVYFTTLGSQNRRWEGRVRQILPTPEIVNDVVLYNVLVDADNKDRTLMTSMTTQMFFVLGRAEGVPVIPASALIRRAPAEKDTGEGTAYIVQVMAGGGTEERIVRTGLSDRANAQVLSGLEEGDRVALPLPQAPDQQSRSRQRMPRL